MTTRLNVYLDESRKRLIKETSGNRKMSEVVNEALESNLAAGLIGELNLTSKLESLTLLPNYFTINGVLVEIAC